MRRPKQMTSVPPALIAARTSTSPVVRNCASSMTTVFAPLNSSGRIVPGCSWMAWAVIPVRDVTVSVERSMVVASTARLGWEAASGRFFSWAVIRANADLPEPMTPKWNASTPHSCPVVGALDSSAAAAACAEAVPSRRDATHPSIVRWRARPRPRAPGGTSSVITDPAAV